jgi:hypothetical protein
MKLANRAKMTTSTTGTGSVTLGVASLGYQTFTAAGVVNGDEIRYVIEDGVNWEIGTGVYTDGVMTRSLVESSTGSLLNLSGTATVLLSITADDFATSADMLAIATAFVNAQTRFVNAEAFQ